MFTSDMPWARSTSILDESWSGIGDAVHASRKIKATISSWSKLRMVWELFIFKNQDRFALQKNQLSDKIGELSASLESLQQEGGQERTR